MLQFNTINEIKDWNGEGFVPDLDIDIYHNPLCPGYSKSALDKIHESPATLAEYKSRPPEARNWGEVGNAVHLGVLQPEVFKEKIIHLPEGVTFAMKAGKETQADAESYGKIVLRYNDWVDVNGMITAIHAHKLAKAFLIEGTGIVEGSAFWTDPDTKVKCKTRPDRLRDDGIVAELKTTEDCSTTWFRNAIKTYRYHVQAAFQMDGVRAVMGRDPKYFVFVAVEKKPPYLIKTYTLQPRAILQGRNEYKRDLWKINQCLEKNQWPGYPEEIETIDLPEYVYTTENI